MPRKSISFFTSASSGYIPSPNEHMFIDDIRTRIMPYGRNDDDDRKILIYFDGDDDSKCEARELLSPLARRSRVDDSELITEAVRYIAGTLAHNGICLFEIATGEDNSNLLSLFHFTTRRLLRVPGYYVQWGLSDDFQAENRTFIFLSQKDVWEIRIPKILGGTRRHKRLIKKIGKNRNITPKFWLEEYDATGNSTAFDFNSFRRMADITLLRLTGKWGWKARRWGSESNTEFFTFYRHIGEQLSRAELREHIITELNRLMARLSISCNIMVEGLSSPEEIIAIRRQLEAGSIGFGDLAKQISV